MDPVRLERFDRLNPRHALAFQEVMESAPEFCLRTTGRTEVARDQARRNLDELPPGKDYEDKFVFGIRDSRGDLVGACDVVRGYPDASTAFVGLLVVDENRRGEGLGRASYEALERLMREWEGVARARLAYVSTHSEAAGFWRAMGFAETGDRKPCRSGGQDAWNILMEKILSY